MKYTLAAIIFCCATVFAQPNPVPFVSQPLIPAGAQPGGSGFTLTINGTNFVSGSVVTWNGTPRATQFVSSVQLTATISADDISKAGTAMIRVSNPSPVGGRSSLVSFPVSSAVSAVSFKPFHSDVSGRVSDVAVEDFNGDGKLDIATIQSPDNTLTVLLGKGDGTFRAPIRYQVGAAPFGITVGDFNGDGRIDVAVACGQADKIKVFLGNGDGTFKAPVSSGYASVEYMEVGDFNRDGKLDLAATNTGDLAILLGRGDGTFQPPLHYTVSQASGPLAIGDFNSDGLLDVATVDLGLFPSVTVLFGDGDGTLGASESYDLGRSDSNLIAADINGDGLLDLMTCDVGDYSLVDFLTGSTNGMFTARYLGNFGAAGTLAVGDFNSDGHIDIASGAADKVGILLDDGTGRFSKAQITYFPNKRSEWVRMKVGDFNGDGRLDLVTTMNQYPPTQSTISVLLQESH